MDRTSRADAIRRWSNLLLAVAQIAVTAGCFAFGTSFEAAAGAPSLDPPIVPAGYAFIIWSAIYAGCLLYGVYQFRAEHAHDGLLRKIGLRTAIAFTGCCAWLLCVRFGALPWTVPCILVMAACLLPVFWQVSKAENASRAFQLCVVAPFSLYAGWLTVAIFANVASVMKAFGVAAAFAASTPGTIALLLAAAALAAFAYLRSGGNLWYGGTILWALTAIGVRNQFVLKNLTVATTAWITLAAFLLLMVLPLSPQLRSAKQE